MDRQELIQSAADFMERSPFNFISEEIALKAEIAGMRIYDAPIFAFGDPEDPLFAKLKEPDVVGEQLIPIYEWQPGAKTVISFFLPYTDQVKKANSRDYLWPADEWLHARIEGQSVLMKLCAFLKQRLEEEGFASNVPAGDPRFKRMDLLSNWSERHAAYICGLGTFGLSKGLITEKGICGRLGSIITTAEFPKDLRGYTELYENCVMCGACVRHCPVKAIDMKTGKAHRPCSDFVDETERAHEPRYGCGKCQVSVPCESRNPKKSKK